MYLCVYLTECLHYTYQYNRTRIADMYIYVGVSGAYQYSMARISY